MHLSIWRCQPKTLDDMRKALHYRETVLTASNSREAIRRAIAQTGLPHETVAERLRISPITLSRWLNGPSSPKFAKLAFKFTLLSLPDADFYSFEIARRGAISYSAAELEAQGWTVTLTLGD